MFMKLVNPAGRGSRKSRRAKHRRRKARARNPFKKRARRRGRRRNPFVLMKKHHHRRGRRGRRRNPLGISTSEIMGQLQDGALGAVGGLALDFALAYLPLPTMLQTGILNYAAKGGVAVGLGLIADKALGSTKGKAVANGALTIAFHEFARAGIKSIAPTVDAKLGDVSAAYFNPAPIVGQLRQNRPPNGPTAHPMFPLSPVLHGLMRDGRAVNMAGLQPLHGMDGLEFATRQLAPGA